MAAASAANSHSLDIPPNPPGPKRHLARIVDESIFEQLVAKCGLSPLFARRSMQKACSRAGISEPESMNKKDLAEALPVIQNSLRLFVGKSKMGAVMQELAQLAGVKPPGNG
jgi:hypothetical protein